MTLRGKREKPTEETVLAEAPRQRPGRLAGRLAAARAKEEEARRAAEERKAADAKRMAEKEQAEKKEKEAVVTSDAKKSGGKGGAGEMVLDTSSTSFQLLAIAAAGTDHEGGVGSVRGGGMNLERIMQVEGASKGVEDGGDEGYFEKLIRLF